MLNTIKKLFLRTIVKKHVYKGEFLSVLNTCNDFAVLREGVKLFHRMAEQTAKRSPCVTASEAGTNKSTGSKADRRVLFKGQ